MFRRTITTLSVVGEDDRLDIGDLDRSVGSHRLAAVIAPAVCFLVPIGNTYTANGLLSTAPAGGVLRDRFASQPSILTRAPLSGFLVTDRHVVTAGHAIAETSASDWIALFDFLPERLAAPDSDGKRRYKFESHQHVGVKAIRLLHNGDPGDDLAILELERAANGRTPASVLCSTPPRVDAPVAMIGHPFAQPMKATVPWPARLPGAPRILHVSDEVLSTTLDAFSGNCGSPVIELDHGKVLAVHNAGFSDQPSTDGLRLPEGSLGAVATRLQRFKSTLQRIGATVA